MNVDSILISHFAQVESSGNLTVVSAFNRISGPGPTWPLGRIYISLVAHAHPDEAGKRFRGKVRLVNKRREDVLDPLEFDGELDIQRSQIDEGMPLRHIVTLALDGLRFGEPGPYAFEVYFDEIYHASANLYVRKVDPAGRA